MYRQPSPTFPTTKSSLTKTSSKKTSLVRSSPIVQVAWMLRPGWSISTRKSVIPPCLSWGSVRAPTQYQSAKCAEVVQILWPSSFQPPSTFWARSCMEAASEPDWGSL